MSGAKSNSEITKRNLSIDGWRGIMAMFIAAVHMDMYYGWPYVNTAYLAVEFFFILSGFLLMKHLCSIPSVDILATPWSVLLGKVKRFWGLSFFCILLLHTWNFFQQNSRSFALYLNTFFDRIGEIFFLQCSGLKMDLLNIPAWYLSALLLGSYFVTVLFCWNL